MHYTNKTLQVKEPADVSHKDDSNGADRTDHELQPESSSPPLPSPPVLWVVGGPGSNKYSRVREVAENHPGWMVLHTGAAICSLFI